MDAGVGEAAVAEGAKTAAEVGTVEAGTVGAGIGESASVAFDLGQVAADKALISSAASLGTGAAATSGILNTLKTAATVLSPVASLVSAASGISASKRMGTTGAPGVPAPVAMPILGGPSGFNAEQSSLAAQLRRRGRASTILTGQDERLGS